MCWFSGPVGYPVNRYSSTPFLVSGKLSSGCVPAIMQDIQLLYGDRWEYLDQLFKLLMMIMIRINLQCFSVGDEWRNTFENPVINVLMCLIQLLIHRYLSVTPETWLCVREDICYRGLADKNRRENQAFLDHSMNTFMIRAEEQRNEGDAPICLGELSLGCLTMPIPLTSI